MDTSEPCDDGASRPVPRLHWRTQTVLPVPADFLPLRLVLQPGGATVELTQADVLLGRHSLADIRLPLPDVSRRHCRFLFSQGVWQVLDLNSLNGVFLNNEPVRQAAVRPGDLLRVGGFTFLVEVGEDGRSDETDPTDSLLRGIFRASPDERRRSA